MSARDYEGSRATCHFVNAKYKCEMPAEHHLLVDDDYVSSACDEHLPNAIEALHPIDHHPYGPVCWLSTEEEPSLRWHMSTAEEVGYCHADDSAEQSALITVSLKSLMGAR